MLKFLTVSNEFLTKAKMFSLACLYNVSEWVDKIILKSQTAILHHWADSLKGISGEAFSKIANNLPSRLEMEAADIRPGKDLAELNLATGLVGLVHHGWGDNEF